MKRPLGRHLLAICLMFSPAAGAAESGSTPAPTAAARAVRPGCAKRVCQRQGFANDREANTEAPTAEARASGVSLLFGLGAAAFHAPYTELGVYPATTRSYPLSAAMPPDVVRIDTYGIAEGDSDYPFLVEQRVKLDGPTLSLGVALEQPLLDTSALAVGLEERFTLVGLLPLSGGSYVAGVMDILLAASRARLPVEVAVGPSLAAARIGVDGEAADWFDEPAVLAAAAALLRFDVRDTLPGRLELVGHYGKTLNYDGASYRDLQLALALEL